MQVAQRRTSDIVDLMAQIWPGAPTTGAFQLEQHPRGP